MDTATSDMIEFEKLVPFKDESFMILKAHLLLEQSLWKFLSARLSKELVKEFRGENSPVSNGKGLIQIAEATAARDEIPIANTEIIWKALYKINSLRNKLVHELNPNRKKIVKDMNEVIKLVVNEAPTDEPSHDFYLASLILVGYLAIDRNPTTMADTI